MSNNEQKKIRQAAMNLLARREHSYKELQQKLSQRGFSEAAITSVLKALTTEGLLSDARFAESYVRMRANRGYGPVRIRTELQERGVTEALIDECLEEDSLLWQRKLLAVKTKKFGDQPAADAKALAKQWRFLQYRGFALQQIRELEEK